jgi:tetratricopeptide (TPR) repeat protein
VKASFETAVSLDPKNGDAVDDLAQYYLDAPGIVGGGVDKAATLAARVQAQLPQRAQRMRALVAEKQKDYATAEREFKGYVDSTSGRADAWVDLGAYYGRRHDADRALEALRKAYAANTAKDSSLVFLATTLNRIGRDAPLATKALQDYLAGTHWDDSAPTFQAHTLLGKQMATAGDKAAARIEYGKALALAPEYEPAKKAMAAL